MAARGRMISAPTDGHAGVAAERRADVGIGPYLTGARGEIIIRAEKGRCKASGQPSESGQAAHSETVMHRETVTWQSGGFCFSQ